MRFSTSSTAFAAAAACLLSPIRLARAQAPAEPPGNQILFGAWTMTEYGDTPLLYNTRVGYNHSLFQIAIDMPQSPYDYVTGAGGPPPEYMIEQTQTDAHVFLTVYPSTFNLRDADYSTLGGQLKNWTEVYNRTVFLRFAPEMQGVWMPYGNQPTAFLAMWRTMYTSIKAQAPQTIIVWAPNTGQGYPYGQTFTGIAGGAVNPNAAADTRLLDTNNDGEFTGLDDPFSPYYPGPEYYDWIGYSVYYKGPNNQNLNVPNGDNFCGQAWETFNPNTNTAGPTNFYQEYCVNNPTKACMFAEAAAAYHVDVAGGASEVEMHQAWWEGCIFNTTFWDAHPRIKGYMHFEYIKNETDGGILDLRDYRNTNITEMLPPYQAALTAFAPRIQFANPRAAPSSIPSQGRPDFLPGANLTVTEVPGLVFQTARALDFSVPTLFFASSAERVQAALISVTTVGAVAMGAATLFSRIGAAAAP